MFLAWIRKYLPWCHIELFNPCKFNYNSQRSPDLNGSADSTYLSTSGHVPWVKQELGPLSFCPPSWCQVSIMSSSSFRGWRLRSETQVCWFTLGPPCPHELSPSVHFVKSDRCHCFFPKWSLCILTTESSGKGSLCISRPRGSFHASPTKGQLQESRPGRVPKGFIPRTLPASRCPGRLGTQRAFTSEMDEWIHWFYSKKMLMTCSQLP